MRTGVCRRIYQSNIYESASVLQGLKLPNKWQARITERRTSEAKLRNNRTEISRELDKRQRGFDLLNDVIHYSRRRSCICTCLGGPDSRVIPFIWFERSSRPWHCARTRHVVPCFWPQQEYGGKHNDGYVVVILAFAIEERIQHFRLLKSCSGEVMFLLPSFSREKQGNHNAVDPR